MVATARDPKSVTARFGQTEALLPLALDVTDEASVAAAVEAGVARFGRIDVGGYRSGPGFGVYCATKFAVEAISEALHAELAPLGIAVTVLEPGYFRTEFLEAKSAVEASKVIDDYADTAGKVRSYAKTVSLQQPGDPERLARVVVDLAGVKSPPLRLPLGTDAIAAIEAKNALVAQELAAWRAVAASTDFPR